VCVRHGVWFDRGELGRAARLIATGELQDLLGEPKAKPDRTGSSTGAEKTGVTGMDMAHGAWDVLDGLSALCDVVTLFDGL
jgi:hypothetical protein